MTKRSIENAIKKIADCKKQNQDLEALLRTYQLNVKLIRFILEGCLPHLALQNKKTKEVVQLFALELEVNSTLKSIISKKSLKPVKLWLKQMDVFYKSLKFEMPKNQSAMQMQGEAVLNLLTISANKLFSRKSQ